MRLLARLLRLPMVVVLLSGLGMGVSGLVETTLSAPDPAAPPHEEPPSVPSDSPGDSRKSPEGKGNHPMRRACGDDVKKFCADVKAGEGRILQCLKEHRKDLSQGCIEAMQQRGKHRP